jgi:hypothetical protein
MPSIAPSVTDSTASTGTWISASRQTTCRPRVGQARTRPQPGTAGGRERPRPLRLQGARAAAVGRTTATAQTLAGAPPMGLLYVPNDYVPKVSARPAEDGVDAELLAANALRLRFLSADLVASAAALFERPHSHARTRRNRLGMEPESGQFRITVGPGLVRLGWTSPVRAEKASERAVTRHRLDVAAQMDRIEASREISTPPGRAITEWSRKSRAAMCRTSPSSTTRHWCSEAACQQ